MKVLILLIFIGTNCFSQNKLEKADLAKITIMHPFHCDFKKQKFEENFHLGELSFYIDYLIYELSNETIKLKGQMKQLDGQDMQTSIQIVTINNTRCKSEKFIGITDIYGNFDITIPNDPDKSIYFTMLSYTDLELKVKDLYSH